MPRSSLFFTAFTFINLLEFMEFHAIHSENPNMNNWLLYKKRPSNMRDSFKPLGIKNIKVLKLDHYWMMKKVKKQIQFLYH